MYYGYPNYSTSYGGNCGGGCAVNTGYVYPYPTQGCCGTSNYAIIIVLFILLVIIIGCRFGR